MRQSFSWPVATLLLGLLACHAKDVASQVEVGTLPILNGQVLLGDSVLTGGTVVLHVLSDLTQGELDSTAVDNEGAFSLQLPRTPDPASGEFYFASVRRAGVMYFGPPITSAIQLDSLYQIQAYDTLLAPMEGVPVTLDARNIFLEQVGESWRVTDLFQIRNDRDRTVVPREGGYTWSYPLAEGAQDVSTAEGEMSEDVVSFEEGSLVVRAALPPGERLFIVRYVLDLPEISVPTPGETEVFDLLVREPAPPLEVDGLQQTASVELDPGESYRRYAGENYSRPVLGVVLGEEMPPPPVEWIAVVLAVVLAVSGLIAFRGSAAKSVRAVRDRRAILLQLAHLDEEFERAGTATKHAARRYRKRRAELMQILHSED